MTAAPTILLADDHAAIRMGLRALVQSLWPDVQVTEVSDGKTLERELMDRSWNLVVLDQNLPGGSGLEVLARLDRSSNVLVYTMHESPELVQKARSAGALGFLSKSCDPGELERAIMAVSGGQAWYPASTSSELDALSRREREVLDALLEGLGPKEIAARLDVTTSSIQTHIARLLAKLELKTTRELFRWAAARGAL